MSEKTSGQQKQKGSFSVSRIYSFQEKELTIASLLNNKLHFIFPKGPFLSAVREMTLTRCLNCDHKETLIALLQFDLLLSQKYLFKY